MKKFLFGPSSLLLLLCFVSCGKASQLKESTQQQERPFKSQFEPQAIKEVEQAILENDLEVFKRIIHKNSAVDVNHQFVNGQTLLTLSILHKREDFTSHLLCQGARGDKKNFLGESPLLLAVSSGQLNIVEMLLKERVNLEHTGRVGDTPLHIAIKNNFDEIALSLIKHGAKLTALDSDGNDAFTLASLYSTPASLTFLKNINNISLGAPDIQTFRGYLEQTDLASIRRVMKNYPELVREGKYEEINPLAILAGSENEKKAIQTAEILLNYGTNINGPLTRNLTPLHQAVILNRKLFTNFLLALKADPNISDKEGKSPLIKAIEANDLYLVELLLSYSGRKNYSLRIDQQRIRYRSCDVAREVGKSFSDNQNIAVNEKIKELLNCGFFSDMF